MPRLLERLHTLWTALRLRLRGGAPGVFYIGGSDTMPAPLEREAEQQAIRALTAGSEDAASLLIEHNLRLVVYIARRFENTGIHIEDLISIGTIGLVKASTPSSRTRTSSLRPTPRAASKTRSSCICANAARRKQR